MRDALLKGKLGISALSPRVTTGKEQWQEWHHDFFHNQVDSSLHAEVIVQLRCHLAVPQDRCCDGSLISSDEQAIRSG